MSAQRFTGQNGRKPSTQARRHVYLVLMEKLREEQRHPVMFATVTNPFDKRRLDRAIEKVLVELEKKSNAGA